MASERDRRIKRLFEDVPRQPADPKQPPKPIPAESASHHWADQPGGPQPEGQTGASETPHALDLLGLESTGQAALQSRQAIRRPALRDRRQTATEHGQAAVSTPDGQEQLLPVDGPLTPLVWESFKLGRPVAASLSAENAQQKKDLGPLSEVPPADQTENAQHQHAAALAYARPLTPTAGASPAGPTPVPGSAPARSVLLEVLDEDAGRRWSEDEILLVEQVTDQLSLALENAQLFQQTQDALEALSVSERYQKSIAQATAVLTERGLAALDDVLRILGEAAQASRAYYIETRLETEPAQTGPAPEKPRARAYWHIVKEWRSEGVPSQLTNPMLQRLSTRWLEPWMERLRAHGYIAEITDDAEPVTRAFLKGLGTVSILQFAVPGPSTSGRMLPGCIGFEQVDYARSWADDEIAALQTAASALANTLAREDLLDRLQGNLAETEALYQASARMNSAADFQEILHVLREYTILGNSTVSSVTINLFDHPWPADKVGVPLHAAEDDRMPQWLIPIARWNSLPLSQDTAQRYPLSAWSTAHLLLHPEQPTLVEDVASDPRLDDLGRAIYHERLNVSSLLYVPVNVSGRWIGHIIATFKTPSLSEGEEPTGTQSVPAPGQTQTLTASKEIVFPENEIRRLSVLSGQAAVAIESLRLLDETQQRNIELAALNQVTSAASGSLELSEVLAEVLRRVLQVIGFESGLVSILHPENRRLYLAVHENLPAAMVRRLTGDGLDGTPCELVHRLGRQIHIANLDRLPDDLLEWQTIFDSPKAMQFQAYLGVGLESKGIRLGTVCAFSKSIRNVNASRLELMAAIGQQVGVVVENAQLFQSTQTALSETEMLYQASAELNAVQSFDDILATLRKYSVLGEVDEAISLDLFDHPWISGIGLGEAPEKVLQAARWNAPKAYRSNAIGLLSESPEPVAGVKLASQLESSEQLVRRKTGELRMLDGRAPHEHSDRLDSGDSIASPWGPEVDETTWSSSQSIYPLGKFPPAHRLLRPDAVVAIEDIFSHPSTDMATRQYYDAPPKGSGQRSIIYAPLVVGGLWIGFIHAIYRTSKAGAHWRESDLRRLEVLASQAAVAAQNLRQVQQIQTRAQYEYLTREIGSQVSSTIDQDSILRITARTLAQALNVSHIIIWATTRRSASPGWGDSGHAPPGPAVETPESGLGTGTGLVSTTPVSAYLYDRRNDQFQAAGQVEDLLLLAEQARRRRGKSPGQRLAPDSPLPESTIHKAAITLRGEHIGEIHAFDLGQDIDGSGNPVYTEWTDNDTALLQTISSQVALSLDNARLFQETQAALSETETLYQASAELNAVQSYDEILHTLRKYTIMGQADNLVHISLFNRPWLVGQSGESSSRPPQADDDIPERITPIAFWSTLPPNRLRRSYDPRSYSAVHLLSASEISIFEDIENDERLDDGVRRLYLHNFHGRATVFAPLTVGGQWIGFINGVYSTNLKYGETEKRRLSALARQAAVAIQNLRLLDESRRRASQLQTAAEIARDTSSTLALQALMRRVVEQICQRFGYYHAAIFLIDDTGSEALIQEATGAAGEALKRQAHSLTVGSASVVGRVSASGEPLTLNDVSDDHAAALHQPNPLLPGTRAELGIPLKIGQLVIGVLDVQADQIDAFSDDDVAVLQVLADQVAVAVDNARAYELSQKAVEEIREADRLKTQFLANMSHELRTPLNSIIGFSRVILKGIDGPVTDLQTTDLTAIYNAGQHLLGLINDVLDLSKIEAGKMELAFEDNVSLAEIIKSVMSTTLGLIKDKNIELKQNVKPDLPRLRLDPMKIRQVLINLLSNAAKFTEEGSITVTARIQTAQSGAQAPEVLVEVRDSGPGIAPQDQLKLFQPFSQVDGSLTRKTGGSGLGLSICHHLIRMHGGRIGLRSTVGQGSTFYFILPVVGPDQPIVVDDDVQPELPDLLIGTEEPLPDMGTQPSPPEQYQDDRETEPAVSPTVAPPAPRPARDVKAGPASLDIEVSASPGEAAGLQPAGPTHPQPAPPIIELPASAATPREQDTAPMPGETEAPAGLVLSIDSDPQIIALYRRYLTNHNFTLISLNDLDRACTVARGLHPIAITLDIAMPTLAADSNTDPSQPGRDAPVTRTNAWQVLNALKNDPETRHIPVIICSLVDERGKAFALGASAYLLKPILEDDLIGVIYDTLKPA